MATRIRIGDCVKIPDGRIARIREKLSGKYKVRVRRKVSKSHYFLILSENQLELTDCPKGWMSREGYNRYLKVTLSKMKKRIAAKKKAKR